MGGWPVEEYTLEAPSTDSGDIGDESGEFTVTLGEGTLSGATVTITPNSSGGGGTFNPTTVVLSDSTTSATFTYTPSSSGSKLIATTNAISAGGSLDDPDSVSYTATVGETATGYRFTGPITAPIGALSAPFTIAPIVTPWLQTDGTYNSEAKTSGTVVIRITDSRDSYVDYTFTDSSTPQTFQVTATGDAGDSFTLTPTRQSGGTGWSDPPAISVMAQTLYILDDLDPGSAPFALSDSYTYYRLNQDVTVDYSAFYFSGNSNSTLDLNGHVVTYDDIETPPTVVNGGFETGDLTGWDVSAAPSASVVAQYLMWGDHMCECADITTTETLVSSEISIPHSGWHYVASLTCYGTAGARLVISVVDAVNDDVLGTSDSVDVTKGCGAYIDFVPSTTHNVKIHVTVSPGGSGLATVSFDYVQLLVVGCNGINAANKHNITIESSVAGGSVIQGRGRSYTSPAINGWGSVDLTIRGLNAYSSGEDTCVVYLDEIDGITIADCVLTAGVDQITNRMASFGYVFMMLNYGSIDIQNTSCTGGHQNGFYIAFHPDAALDATVVIKNNRIHQDSCWTNGYGIELYSKAWNFEIAYNSIVPIHGRGIMLDTGGIPGISNGIIHDNYVEVQEMPDLEYGQLGLQATGFRMRNYNGVISNLSVYNNIFYAHTDVGLDSMAIGCRVNFYNVNGQVNNSNVVFYDNIFRGIVIHSDTSLTDGSLAAGLEFARIDTGTGILFKNNVCESNGWPLNICGSDGANSNDISFVSNTIKKSSDGETLAGYADIHVGWYNGYADNIRVIDTQYTNGATGPPDGLYLIGTSGTNVSTGWLLDVTVYNHDGVTPANGATVTVTDTYSNQATYTADSNGQVLGIEVPTTVYAITQTLLDPNPLYTTTTSNNPFTIAASLSGKTASLTDQTIDQNYTGSSGKTLILSA